MAVDPAPRKAHVLVLVSASWQPGVRPQVHACEVQVLAHVVAHEVTPQVERVEGVVC